MTDNTNIANTLLSKLDLVVKQLSEKTVSQKKENNTKPRDEKTVDPQLSGNEKKRYESIAKELNKVFKFKDTVDKKDDSQSISASQFDKVLKFKELVTPLKQANNFLKSILVQSEASVKWLKFLARATDSLNYKLDETAEKEKRDALKKTISRDSVKKPETLKSEKQKEEGGGMSTLLKMGVLAAILGGIGVLLSTYVTGPLKGIIQLASKWLTVGGLKMVAASIKAFLSPLLDIFSHLSFLKEGLGKVLTTAGKFIMDKVSLLTKGIWYVLESGGKFIFEALSTLKNKIGGMFKVGSEFIIEKLFGKSFNISKLFSAILDPISSSLSGIFKSLTSGSIGKAITSKLGSFNFLKMFSGAGSKLFGFLSKGLKFLKPIPLLGTLISFYFAYDRFKTGDTIGGVIEIASGIAGIFPGIGTAISIGLDVINAVRDFKKDDKEKSDAESSGSWFGDAIGKVGTFLASNLYNVPFLGSVVRAAEHLINGRWKEGFTSLGYAIPGVGFILGLFDIKETDTESKEAASESWLTKAMNDVKAYVMENWKSFPIIGSLGRAWEHLSAGNYLEGFISLAHAFPIPGFGAIIDFLGFPKEASIEDSNFKARTFDLGAIKDWFMEKLLNMPVVGPILKSIGLIAEGKFAEGFSMIVPERVMNLFKKKVAAESQKNTSSGTATSTTADAAEASTSNKSVSPNIKSTTDVSRVETSRPIDVNGINELHTLLKQSNQSEVTLLTTQNKILNESVKLLQLIANNITNMQQSGNSSNSSAAAAANNYGSTIEASYTKNQYMNNMKLLTTSLA